MRRVTKGELEQLRDMINKATDSPIEAWTRQADGVKSNPGHYCLSWAYGGVCLERITTDGGGVRSVLPGYGTKRELYDKMSAFLDGIQAGKK